MSFFLFSFSLLFLYIERKREREREWESNCNALEGCREKQSKCLLIFLTGSFGRAGGFIYIALAWSLKVILVEDSFRFFTRSSARDSPYLLTTTSLFKTLLHPEWGMRFRSPRPLFQNSFSYSLFPLTVKGGYFRFWIPANHPASLFFPVRRLLRTTRCPVYLFFIHPLTECKHLLAFNLTHILYFLRQAGRSWTTLLFLFLAVIWRPANSNTEGSRNSLFLFSQ